MRIEQRLPAVIGVLTMTVLDGAVHVGEAVRFREIGLLSQFRFFKTPRLLTLIS